MDVGIVEKTTEIMPLIPEDPEGVNGARGAAYVE
jgi:hypothetical protein